MRLYMRSAVAARGGWCGGRKRRGWRRGSDGGVGEDAGSDGGRMEVGYEGAAGSAALIKLAEDNEPVCRLACLVV